MTPLPGIEPRRLIRDRLANLALWSLGVGLLLAPGAVVAMAAVGVFSASPTCICEPPQ